VWLLLNRAPPNWDDAWYLSNSLILHDAWTSGGMIGLVRRFLASLGFKAPLITALPLPFYWIFGRRWHAAFLVNIVAMLILFAAVWQIGKRLRSERAGLIAVYIVGTLPLLYGLSRWYLVEYPMAALVAAAFLLALVTAGSAKIAPAVLLGFTCGLGLLLKADFPLFVLPMLIYVLWRRGARASVVLPILLPCIALGAPWYAYHWRATLDNAIAAGFGASAVVQGTGAIFSVSAIRAYLGLVMYRGVSPYYVLLTVAASIAVASRRRFEVFRQIAPLWLWLLPFLIFVFGGNKDVRYIAPLLPAFALGAACILDAAAERARWLAVPVLVFPLVASLAISFGWPYDAADVGYANRYDARSWGQDEILSAIASDGVFRYGERKRILLGSDRGHFNANNFELSIVQWQLPLQVDTTAYSTSLNDVLGQAAGAAYFVYKEGGEPESAFFNLHSTELLRRLKQSAEWQELPFACAIPDGGTAHILRHR
jgi:hypothetical protein